MNPLANTSAKTDLPATLEDLAVQIEALRADIAGIASTVASGMVDGVQVAGRKLVRSGREAQASMHGKVVEHPLAAIGIAAGLGLLVGLVARR